MAVVAPVTARIELFPADILFLIAGPCVLESDDLNLRVAEKLARLAERVPGGVIFKASFDKANRSNVDAARGPGMDEGLSALLRIKRETGLRVLTDVHLPEQCAPAAEVADALQIPAFLCRQTDLLVAAGTTSSRGRSRCSRTPVTRTRSLCWRTRLSPWLAARRCNVCSATIPTPRSTSISSAVR